MNNKTFILLIVPVLLIVLGIIDLSVSQLHQSPKCGISSYGRFDLLEYLTAKSIMYLVSGVFLILFIIIFSCLGRREDRDCVFPLLKMYLGMICLLLAIFFIVGLAIVLPSGEGQHGCHLLNFPLWQLSLSSLILTPFMLITLLILSVIMCSFTQ